MVTLSHHHLVAYPVSDLVQKTAEHKDFLQSGQIVHFELSKRENERNSRVCAPADQNIITHPAHYLQGRTIEPIDVIEAWELCHHLACVVKYLARAGRKNSIVEDLKKAEWYLNRMIEKQLDSGKRPFSSYSPRQVRDDWGLSLDLGIILSLIYGFKTFQSQALLRDALDVLRSKIFHLEVEAE